MTDNCVNDPRKIEESSEEFWRAWDKLPKTLRDVLIECPVDYSAVQVYEAYKQLWENGHSSEEAVYELTWMIVRNIATDLELMYAQRGIPEMAAVTARNWNWRKPKTPLRTSNLFS